MLRSGLDFRFKRRQNGFVAGETLKLFESYRSLLRHPVLEVETNLLCGFVNLLRIECRVAALDRIGFPACIGDIDPRSSSRRRVCLNGKRIVPFRGEIDLRGTACGFCQG